MRKIKISNQRKIYYEETEDKKLQQPNDRYINSKELARACVELETRLRSDRKKLKTSFNK